MIDNLFVICEQKRMRSVQYSDAALRALRKHRSRAAAIMEKIERFAETGAGDVKALSGEPYLRLRVGDFRVVFRFDNEVMRIIDIGPRGSIYGKD